MKKAILAAAIAAATTIGFAGTAAAGGGKSDVGKTHPGHAGYINSDMKGGGVPAYHFHEVAPYEIGPGGWGGLVSETAKGGGIPGAHG